MLAVFDLMSYTERGDVFFGPSGPKVVQNFVRVVIGGDESVACGRTVGRVGRIVEFVRVGSGWDSKSRAWKEKVDWTVVVFEAEPNRRRIGRTEMVTFFFFSERKIWQQTKRRKQSHRIVGFGAKLRVG